MSAAERLLQYSEAEAALRLGISKSTLVRERLAGKVHPVRIGQRIIRYTDEILSEYLRQCRNGLDNLATTGSASAPAPTNGAVRGTTKSADRHDAHRLAQATFKKVS